MSNIRIRPYTRSSKKPPEGTRCDTATPDYSSSHPVLKRCTNEATVELKGGYGPWETWVCESCAESLLSRSAPSPDRSR